MSDKEFWEKVSLNCSQMDCSCNECKIYYFCINKEKGVK